MGQTRDFFNWLDSRKAGQEARSFILYQLNRQIEASNIDIDNYVKKGSVLDLLPGLYYKPNNEHYNAKSTQKAILKTRELDINNVSAFVLSASVCYLFSTIIMELLSNSLIPQ